jgi:cyanophycinase
MRHARHDQEQSQGGKGWVVAEGGGLGSTPENRAAIMARIVELARKAAGNEKPRVIILGATRLEEVDERRAELIAAGAEAENLDTPDDVDPHDPAIVAKVAAAHAIFMRGGDQSRYVLRWRGGALEGAIRSVFEKGGVVGGTSAGCAVLGEWTYDSNKGSLSATEALADGRHEELTLTHGFFGFVPGVLFDTHFTERGRVARLAVMLGEVRERREAARTASNSDPDSDDAQDVLGIGVDPETAVIVGPDGVAEVFGIHSATLLRLGPTSIVDRGPSPTPPTLTNIRYSQLLPGTRFDATSGEVLTRPDSVHPNPHPDAIADSAFEAMTLDGNDAALSRLGLLRFVREASVPPPNGGSTSDGCPTFISGEGKLPGVLVSGRTFAGDDTWEVLASTQRTLASQPSVIALWLDDGCRVSVGERGEVLVSPDSTSSLVVLDGTGVRFVGVLAFENFRGPAHIEGATLHVLGRGMTFEMGTRPIRVRRRD